MSDIINTLYNTVPGYASMAEQNRVERSNILEIKMRGTPIDHLVRNNPIAHNCYQTAVQHGLRYDQFLELIIVSFANVNHMLQEEYKKSMTKSNVIIMRHESEQNKITLDFLENIKKEPQRDIDLT